MDEATAIPYVGIVEGFTTQRERTVAEIQVGIDGDRIQGMLGGGRGLVVLIEQLTDQVLEHEITEHLQAK
ncbi:MAG: hypothetical protein ACOC9N_03260 [Gemmatimonadota bacterium]